MLALISDEYLPLKRPDFDCSMCGTLSRPASPLNEHRHDDVRIVVLAHRSEKAWTGRAGGLQRYLRFAEHTEDVGEVLAVKGNLGIGALYRSVDLADIVADFLRAGGYSHLAGA